MVQRTLTDQHEHTLPTRVGVWYIEHTLSKQSIHSDEGLCMVQRTLTDQPEHTLPTRAGVWYREHSLINQSIHFRRGLVHGTENTY